MSTKNRAAIVAKLKLDIAGYKDAAAKLGYPEPWIVKRLEAALKAQEKRL